MLGYGFSALQRAEIAEIETPDFSPICDISFSALQRAEIAEIQLAEAARQSDIRGFSALQRAEIAEMYGDCVSGS